MLYRAENLRRLEVKATDGTIGVIKDLYFDDFVWSIRYLVVNTGGWLLGRDVLISREALLGYSDADSTFATNLTRQQIEDSPSVEFDKPVSRQMEAQLSRYYGWAPYWSTPFGLSPWAGLYSYPPAPASFEGMESPAERESDLPASQGDPHLRSFQEIRGYALRAIDGDIGEVEDLLIEPETWRITHLVADAQKWWPGGLVVIDRAVIKDISWLDKKVAVNMTRDEVKNAPAFDGNQPITESYQQQISDYYRSNFVDRIQRHSVSDYQHLRPGDQIGHHP